MEHQPHRAGFGFAVVALVIALSGEASASPCESNLLIVLDRSCSMKGTPKGATLNKWELAVAAIDRWTTEFAGKIRFGLVLFPDKVKPKCEQGEIPIPVGDDKEQAIRKLLGETTYDAPCTTPIKPAIDQAATDPALSQQDRRSFVLLITDGRTTCGGDDAAIATTIAGLHGKLINTFVIGFGGGVDPIALSSFAEAGGTARSGSTKYYQADDAAQLDAALKAIGERVGGDIEFSGCQGVPCPDGRCRADATCIAGFCQLPFPDGLWFDLGVGTRDAGADAEGSATGGSLDGETGCSCAVTGEQGTPALPLAFLSLLAGFALRSINRRTRRRFRRGYAAAPQGGRVGEKPAASRAPRSAGPRPPTSWRR